MKIRDDKIQSIKSLRTYVTERYGVCPGLKESKDFIDYLERLQGQEELREQLKGELLHLARVYGDVAVSQVWASLSLTR